MLAVKADGVTSWDRTRDLLLFRQVLSQAELKPREWKLSDSNRPPPGCKPGALPDELSPQMG